MSTKKKKYIVVAERNHREDKHVFFMPRDPESMVTNPKEETIKVVGFNLSDIIFESGYFPDEEKFVTNVYLAEIIDESTELSEACNKAVEKELKVLEKDAEERHKRYSEMREREDYERLKKKFG